MKLDTYRKWLIGVWCGGFIIPFILILVQYGNGKYGGKFAEVLGWLTSLIVPTILLMIGVMVSNPAAGATNKAAAKNKPEEEKKHEKFIFQLAVGFSALYLLIINVVFFLEPFANEKPLELIRDSKIFLAGFSSLISLLIGYFFGKK